MLSIHDAKKLQSFLSLLDSDAPDSELLALADEDLPSEPLVVDEEVLPLVPLPAHAARQHSIALHVLQGSLVFFLLFVFCFVLVCCALLGGASSTHVDLTRRFLVDNDVVVSFDNCVHSSGHQRAYIRCCAGRAHEACFKYTVIHRHASEVILSKQTWNKHKQAHMIRRTQWHGVPLGLCVPVVVLLLSRKFSTRRLNLRRQQ